MGDGGMICCDDENDAKWFKKMRFYGQDGTEITGVGVNSRMDEFQCAVVNAKMETFMEMTKARVAIAEEYKKFVRGIKANGNCIYHQFVVMFDRRNRVIEDLEESKISYMIHYPMHVSEMVALSGIKNYVGFIVNDKILSLPCHAFMSQEDIDSVVSFLRCHADMECK
jgi:UDP-2-acetamido-2-deoxy-ribo-hexuluronate aminotransferase